MQIQARSKSLHLLSPSTKKSNLSQDIIKYYYRSKTYNALLPPSFLHIVKLTRCLERRENTQRRRRPATHQKHLRDAPHNLGRQQKQPAPETQGSLKDFVKL